MSIARMRWLRLAILLFMLVDASDIPVAAQNTALWMTSDQREKLLNRLSDSLPPGWSVTRVVENQVPDEWRTFETRTLGIEGKNRERSFHLWIVPEDWVGIRPQKSAFPRYGPEAYVLDRFKMILQSDYAVYQALERWRLVSARGWKTEGRENPQTVARVEEQTKALVERFCSDRACRDEAAYSLIVLGISARAVTLDCAEHGSGEAQEVCLGVLQAWPGPETLRILHSVLSRKPSAPVAVKAAAWALRYIGVDEASGPALLEALRNEPGREAEGVLLDALAETHYESAAPEILARLERAAPDSDCTLKCAKTLAALRYSPAIPAIRKFDERDLLRMAARATTPSTVCGPHDPRSGVASPYGAMGRTRERGSLASDSARDDSCDWQYRVSGIAGE